MRVFWCLSVRCQWRRGGIWKLGWGLGEPPESNRGWRWTTRGQDPGGADPFLQCRYSCTTIMECGRDACEALQVKTFWTEAHLDGTEPPERCTIHLVLLDNRRNCFCDCHKSYGPSHSQRLDLLTSGFKDELSGSRTIEDSLSSSGGTKDLRTRSLVLFVDQTSFTLFLSPSLPMKATLNLAARY